MTRVTPACLSREVSGHRFELERLPFPAILDERGVDRLDGRLRFAGGELEFELVSSSASHILGPGGDGDGDRHTVPGGRLGALFAYAIDSALRFCLLRLEQAVHPLRNSAGPSAGRG